MSRASVPLAFPQIHAWGLDLSGTETGAGGVGGLLFAKLHATPGTPVLAPCYDGNGNILAYLDCATGQTLARYEYDPFGKLLLKEEDTRVAGRLHHQFSTKYTDDETGLSYYGYRYYASELGRWVNRDPIGEKGGINLYGILANNVICAVDNLGRTRFSECRDKCFDQWQREAATCVAAEIVVLTGCTVLAVVGGPAGVAWATNIANWSFELHAYCQLIVATRYESCLGHCALAEVLEQLNEPYEATPLW